MSCPISGVSFSLEPAYPNTTHHTATPAGLLKSKHFNQQLRDQLKFSLDLWLYVVLFCGGRCNECEVDYL